jgi:hypothetical protein
VAEFGNIEKERNFLREVKKKWKAEKKELKEEKKRHMIGSIIVNIVLIKDLFYRRLVIIL